ncbi:MAG: exodeoxyribonuclease VII large subunit, partial [Phycisphaerae bacterium]|nr:exodeoxyribonuclease VII large subunit [Phycisphaerae bacterium]
MRKPFDPLLIPEPKDEASAKPLAVAELTRRIRNALEARFGRVWVVGEISNLSRPSSGHIYFSLKDLASAVNCVMWRAKAAKVKCTVTDGLEVEVRGRLTVYEPQGRYQIVVDSIKPRGVGALEVAFRKLKERLAGEGLFESERKRPLPCFPGCIGIVTSPTGAAVRDIIHVTGRRWPQARLVLAPVRVQGEGAAEEIAQAIADLNRLGGVDVMIVGRGGGSLEDLWPFNEEVVAREIYTSEIPVISAVGHETDFSISDCVADVRAPTPSAAAEIVVPNAKELLRHLASAEQHLFSYITSEAERAGNRLAIISGSRY